MHKHHACALIFASKSTPCLANKEQPLLMRKIALHLLHPFPLPWTMEGLKLGSKGIKIRSKLSWLRSPWSKSSSLMFEGKELWDPTTTSPVSKTEDFPWTFRQDISKLGEGLLYQPKFSNGILNSTRCNISTNVFVIKVSKPAISMWEGFVRRKCYKPW